MFSTAEVPILTISLTKTTYLTKHHNNPGITNTLDKWGMLP